MSVAIQMRTRSKRLRGLRWLAACVCLLAVPTAGTQLATAERVLGIDVSAWQGSISERSWGRLRSQDNQDFAFIRSSRGGTTGFYNQSDPNNNNGANTLSQRYDDPYFVQNITRATQAGMLAGPYHFSRADIVTNTGADEADHFIEMAGAWMRPGYLLPVHDLEAGDGFRSDNSIAQFALDFSDRIHEVMGIRPAIYLNGNYARYVIGGASSSLRNAVVDTYPVMWNARPESGADVQTEHPSDYLSWTYGAWDDPPNPTHPWSFWQYSWTGNLINFNGNIDLNVAQGGMEFLKDNLVPAIWTGGGSGDWSTLTNWNSGQTPVAPVQGPGQVPRVGSLTLPDVRLPSSNDTVILDDADGSFAVTMTAGSHEIRKLVVREQLNLLGGSLTVNYVPVAESTPYTAHFAADVTLDGGELSAHTIQVDSAYSFGLGGTISAEMIELMPHASTPAKLELIGDVSFNPLATATTTIANGVAAGTSGYVDLGGDSHTWNIADGPSAVDVLVDVPVTNGGLVKAGDGTLALEGPNTYDGDTVVVAGVLGLGDAFLDDEASLHLGVDGVVDLDFAGTDTIEALFIDGISQSVGIWGAVGSGAEFTSPHLTGAGLLQVTELVANAPGDFNGDGTIDESDLARWETDYGQGVGSDADGDGDSDGNDFLIWQANAIAAASSAASSVPEPSSLLLASLAVGFAAGSRRR